MNNELIQLNKELLQPLNLENKPTHNTYRDILPESRQIMTKRDYDIGWYLSAMREDESTPEKMRNEIDKWFKQFSGDNE